MAHADGSLFKLLKKLSRAALLVVDDWGIAQMSSQQYRDFLEILEDRSGNAATLITSQWPLSQWHELIGEPTIADAIMERLMHNAYRIELEGESMRKIRSGKTSAKHTE